ncbi:fungal-specific transcription factor domain-containing protein [Phaeosphaeria sp. MPI-PUGE-AT-0046c]|nr:fungal-specific transcription factor domain-containing protein [Phaeosphaeria sp. MPI-PUGE-AT-0046c]
MSRPQDAGVEHTSSHRIFACDRCSRRKQRCDKVLPTCGQCHEARSSCISSEREHSVVQLSDNEVTRKGYVTSLQERIASLERQIHDGGFSTVESAPNTEGENHAPVNQPSIGMHHSATPMTRDSLSLESPDMGMNSLALSAMAEPSSRAGEFLKHLSMSRIIAGMTETYGGDPEKTARADSLWDGIAKYIRHPTSQSHRLHIQREEASKALDAYLVTVDFRYPRLPVDKIRSGIEAITAKEEITYRQKYSQDPAHVFMAYMIIAIVPLVSDNYPISQGSFVSIHVLAKCMRVLDRVFAQEDGIDIIQCLHLLVIFSIHCSAAGSAWHLIGLAVSKCIALGYHREEAQPTGGQDGIEQAEQRRWVFWGCYLLDRLICSALGRPYSIDDRYITVALPGADKEPPTTLSMEDTHHIHLFRYAQLLSRVGNDTVHESFDDSLSRLLNWRISAPSSQDLSIRQIHLFQTSLFHTLMLRLAIKDIVSRCSISSGIEHGFVVYQYGQGTNTQQILKSENERIQSSKLLHICRAVATSLDRRHMAGRHYLSLTTGYSALSMALATIYSQIVTSMSASSSPGQWEAEGTHDSVLDIAAVKLNIVGRQFPRLHEYRDMVERIRHIRQDLHNTSELSQSFTAIGEVEECLQKVSPLPLRNLGLVITYLLRWEHQILRTSSNS